MLKTVVGLAIVLAVVVYYTSEVEGVRGPKGKLSKEEKKAVKEEKKKQKNDIKLLNKDCEDCCDVDGNVCVRRQAFDDVKEKNRLAVEEFCAKGTNCNHCVVRKTRCKYDPNKSAATVENDEKKAEIALVEEVVEGKPPLTDAQNEEAERVVEDEFGVVGGWKKDEIEKGCDKGNAEGRSKQAPTQGTAMVGGGDEGEIGHAPL